MLTLHADQLEALEQLDRDGFAAALRRGLADVWPLVAARLGPGFDALIATALSGAQQHSLHAPWQAAGYVNLCCVFGAGFDAKPGFEWARDILAARERKPELRLHQLVQHTRELLARGASAPASPGRAPSAGPGLAPSTSSLGTTVSQFDAVLERLPALTDAASACGVFVQPPSASAAVVACDLAGVEVEIGQAAGHHEYELVGGAWRRQPVAAVPARVRLDAALAQPQPLAALGAGERAASSLRQGPAQASRLRLRLQALAQCDRARHPSVTVDGPQGRLQWRGRDAMTLTLPLLGPPLPPVDTAIAPDLEPATNRIAIETCGVRDHGAPIGPLALDLRVHPAAQTWCEWRVGALPALHRPTKGPPSEPAAIAVRLERDGAALDAAPWLSAWQALHTKLTAGLEQLFGTWARVGAIESPRMDAQVAALQGAAAMTWGCRQADVSSVFTRVQGRVDMLACAVDITLAGEIAQSSARARITLRARGRCELRCDIARDDPAMPIDAALAGAVAQWRFPFEIDVEPIASAQPAILGMAIERPSLGGTITGMAGLRPRGEGGLQWFFTLSCEPAQLATTVADPLFGVAGSSRALLPAMVLVDWNSG